MARAENNAHELRKCIDYLNWADLEQMESRLAQKAHSTAKKAVEEGNKEKTESPEQWQAWVR